MAKKEQILELLNAYKSEVDNFNDAIFTDKFEVLSQDIVKLFAIPVVVVPKGTLCKCKKPNRYYCKKTGGDRCRKCKTLL
tara:strand:+ start:28888 stop:29127 length:240 start_codon:yes stop_codon:yes gene_type:complete